MKCTNPITIKRGGHEEHTISVPCRKCLTCLKNISHAWSSRLEMELTEKNALFITLTYHDLYNDGELHLDHITKFLKRLRKKFYGNGKSDLKYFYCGEYGEKSLRPHYHIILFGLDAKDLYVKNGIGGETSLVLNTLWPYGINNVGSVTRKSIHYVTGYVLKNTDEEHKGFRHMSKNLGKNYMLKNKEQYEKMFNGGKIKLGRYEKGLIDYTWAKLEELTNKDNQEDMKEFLKKNKAKYFNYELAKKYADREEDKREYRQLLAAKKNELFKRDKL